MAMDLSPAVSRRHNSITANNVKYLESETASTDISTPDMDTPSPNQASENFESSATLTEMPPPPKRIKNKETSSEVDMLLNYLESKNQMKQKYDAVDHLFLSYAQTFKRFSARKQAMMKINLANLFAEAELSELIEKCPSTPSPNGSVVSITDSEKSLPTQIDGTYLAAEQSRQVYASP